MNQKLSSRVLMASAGTGKTYRLSLEYIMRLVYEQRQPAFAEDCYKSILAITFTKKATAELRQRIFEQLYKIINGDKGLTGDLNDVLAKNNMPALKSSDIVNLDIIYKNMCANKHKIYIKTIDGFVNMIFERCVAPVRNVTNVQIVNNHDDGIYYEVLEKIFADKNIYELFNRIYYSNEDSLLEGKATVTCLKIVKDIIGNRFLFTFSKNGQHLYQPSGDDDILLRNIMDLMKEMTGFVGKNCDPKSPYGKNLVSPEIKFDDIESDSFAELLEKIKKNISDEKFINNNIKQLIKKPFFFNGRYLKVKKENAEDKADLEADLQSALIKYEFYRKNGILETHNKYYGLYDGIFKIYSDVIFSRKEFDFNDIALETYKAFYESDDLCKYDDSCKSRKMTPLFFSQSSTDYRHCLIDEAQDTSVLQWAIISPLLHSIDDFTIVGDQKQAIYSWRGGESGLLGKIKDNFEGREIVLENLEYSFRSDKKIISTVNEIFKAAAKEVKEITDEHSEEYDNTILNWDYLSVEPKSEKEGSTHFYFDMYKEESKKSERDKTIYAHETKEDCYKYFTWDIVIKTIKDNNLPLKDVAILARKNDDLMAIAAILKENNIDYYLDLSKSLFEHKAVKAVLDLLKFIARNDYERFFEFIKSELINISPSEYQRLLRKYRDKKNNLFKDEQFQFIKKIQEFVDNKSTYNGVYALIKDIYTEFGVNNVYTTDIDSKNLYQLLELSLKFDNDMVDYNKSLSGFLLYIEDNADSESLASLSTVDAVRLITTHKSKGLQFKHVFVYSGVSSHAGGGMDGPKVSILSNYNYDYTGIDSIFLMKSTDRTNIGKCRDVDDELIQKCINSIKKADCTGFIEKLNTFYVAVTRPKNDLFVYTTSPNKYDGSSKTVLGNIFSAEVLFSLYNVKCEFENEFPCECHDGQIVVEAETEQKGSKTLDLNELMEYFDFDVNRSAVVQTKPTESFESLFDGKEKRYAQRKRLTGLAVHDYLSQIKYGRSEELSAAKQYLYTKYGNIFTREQFGNIFEKVDDFILSSKNEEIFSENWTRILNEYQLFDKKTNSMKRIDRLLIDDTHHKVIVVDYKTGQINEDQLEGYENLVGELGLSKENGWTVVGKFAELKI